MDDAYILSGATVSSDRKGGSSLAEMPEVIGNQCGVNTTRTGTPTAGSFAGTGDTPGVDEGTPLEAAGSSALILISDLDDSSIAASAGPRGLLRGPAGVVGDTYVFDTSDGGPTDPDASWTDDANAFDGSTSTFAYTTVVGDWLNDELSGKGTDAPGSGGTIGNVFVRVFCEGPSGTNIGLQIISAGSTLLNANVESVPTTAAWSRWTPIVDAVGGWTWAKVQALECVSWLRAAGTLKVYKVEVFVEHSSGGETVFVGGEASGTIIGAKYIYRLKRSSGSGTSMRYWFGNSVDGETSSPDIEGDLGTSYTIKEQISEATGIVPGPKIGDTYYFDASDGGPTDPDTEWVSDSQAFNGSVGDGAVQNTANVGSATTGYLEGEGTTAPASGGTISQVMTRVFYDIGTGAELEYRVTTDAAGETLVTVPSASLPEPPTGAIWSEWFQVSVPSGGWTWAKLQALEVRFWDPSNDSSGVLVLKCEIFVRHTTGTETLENDFSVGISAGTDDTGGRELFCSEIWAMLLYVPAAGGQTIAIGFAAETDAAFGIVPMKTAVIVLATETDAGQAMTALRSRTVAAGLAPETDAAFVLDWAKAVPMGFAAETDAAFPAPPVRAWALGLALETDAAFAATSLRSRTVAMGLANETDVGFAAPPLKSAVLGLAAEIDEAFAAPPVRAWALGLASETDIAFAAPPAHLVVLGAAAETDTAFPVIVAGEIIIEIGAALESDTAFALVAERAYAMGLASETDTPFAASPLRTYVLGLVTETDSTFPTLPLKTVLMGLASESDTAFASVPGLGVPVGFATETDVALVMTALRERFIAAGLASETDTAFVTVPERAYAVGLVTETDIGLALTIIKTVQAGLAAENDTALAMQPLRAYAMGLAAETDVALVAVPERAWAVGFAPETDTAFAASYSRAVLLGAAAETDTAFPAPPVRAWALGLASETDVAQPLAKIIKTVLLGLAQEFDTAPGLQGDVGAAAGFWLWRRWRRW